MARIDAPPMKRLEAWVFLRSGAERTHFGEVRFRMEGDTPMSDAAFFEEGWVRAVWLDSPRRQIDRVHAKALLTPPPMPGGQGKE